MPPLIAHVLTVACEPDRPVVCSAVNKAHLLEPFATVELKVNRVGLLTKILHVSAGERVCVCVSHH